MKSEIKTFENIGTVKSLSCVFNQKTGYLEWGNGDKTKHDANGRLHSEKGAAMIWSNGDEFNYKHGKRHCETGAAVKRHNGEKEWYINDQQLSKSEFLKWKKEYKKLKSKKTITLQ